MQADFGALGLFLVVAIVVPVTFLLVPFLLGFVGVVERKPSEVKASTYECGMKPIKQAWVQFNFRYYMFALLFVVFDIVAVLLYPWAVGFISLSRELKVFGFLAVVVFLLVMIVGLAHAWKKKALEWE